MGDRFTKIVVGALLVVLAVYLAQPYVDRLLFSASTPRTVEPRGSLSDLERMTIEIFERVSPSVVQVVGRAGALEAPPSEGENGPTQSGTGFVWDAAGHIVTNDHVVEGTAVSPFGSHPARYCAPKSSGPRPTTTSRSFASTTRVRCRRRLRSAHPTTSKSGNGCLRSAIRSASINP